MGASYFLGLAHAVTTSTTTTSSLSQTLTVGLPDISNNGFFSHFLHLFFEG